MFEALRNNLRPRLLVLLLLLSALCGLLAPWLLPKSDPKAETADNQETVENQEQTTPGRHARARTHETTKQSSGQAPSSADEAAGRTRRRTILLRNEEDFLRLRDWAAANGMQIVREIPALHALSLRLSPHEYEHLLRNSNLDFAEEEEYRVFIPDFGANEKYPAWQGSMGPGFVDTFREYLGVNVDDHDRGKGVTIALLDTPVVPCSTLENASIQGMVSLPAGAQADISHGTAVASILTGETGISNADVLAYGVLDEATGSGSAFDLSAAIIEAVDAGASVISLSLGSYDDSALLRAAVDYALEKEVFLVAAAGNNGVEDVCYPAAYDGVLAVGAIDANGNVAAFSNFGEGIDLVAPGVELTFPYAVTDETGEDTTGYYAFSGTSAAVPCVAAVLANFLAENPSATFTETYRTLLETCNDTEAPGFDAHGGYGILDAERLASSDQAGIYDAAAAGITFDETTGVLTATAQNTGTETLSSLTLLTQVNGLVASHTFTDISPNGVASVQLELPAEILNAAESLSVQTAVLTKGVEDARDRNQTHRQTFPMNQGGR